MVAKNLVSDKEIADAARALIALLTLGTPTPAAKVSKVAKTVAEEEEDVETEASTEPLDREETEALSIKELRVLAKEYGLTSIKKSEILEGLAEFYADDDDEDEEEDEADEDEDEEEDDDEESDEEPTRDDLSELSLAELRIEAKANGHKPSEYRGMDQDALIDLILGEDEEEEDEEEEEADDDEEEIEELDEDALNAMSLVELRELAKEVGVKVKVPVTAKTDLKKKKVFVEAILNSADEE